MITCPFEFTVEGVAALAIVVPCWKVVLGLKSVGAVGAPTPVRPAILPLSSTLPMNEGGSIVYVVPSALLVAPVGMGAPADTAITIEPSAFTSLGGGG